MRSTGYISSGERARNADAQSDAGGQKRRNPPKRVSRKLEAWVGIEPAYADLQSAA